MSSETFMWLLMGWVALLVGSPIIWGFAKRGLIKMGWLAKLSKLDELALNHDLRGYWERRLAFKCAIGVSFIALYGLLSIVSASHNSIDLGQSAFLISGLVGVSLIGSTTHQLLLGWDRASQSKFVKQTAHEMELRRETLTRRFGEEKTS